MSVGLLPGNFIKEFKRRVEGAKKVEIASAWMTENGALDALIDRKGRCLVRAIIGTNGNVTSPTSLSSLASAFGWPSLRIVEPRGRLFHPKLFLFHYRRKPSVAWIGSANFTGHGMEVNTELLLEIDDMRTVAAMREWFDEAWNNCAPDARRVFEAYRERHEPPHRFEGDRGGASSPARSPKEPVADSPRYLPDLRQLGSLKFRYFGEDRWAESYADIARYVLVAFADADSRFLRGFAKKDKERVGSRGARKRYLSTDLGQVGKNPPKKPRVIAR